MLVKFRKGVVTIEFSRNYRDYLSCIRPDQRDDVRAAYRLYQQSGTVEAYYFYREVLANAQEKYQRECFRKYEKGD